MDLVKIENGQVYTDSLLVSTAFGKQHKNVIQNIEILISNMMVLKEESNPLGEIGGVLKIQPPQSSKEIQKFFVETSYVNEQNKTEYKKYLMTQDGFSLLVMGFTGQKALEWKLKYIEAFNRMRKSLNQVKELDILNSKEWQLIKGSAASLSHIEKNIKTKLKDIEKIIKSMEDDRLHIQIFSDQVSKMTRNVEKGELRDKNIY